MKTLIDKRALSRGRFLGRGRLSFDGEHFLDRGRLTGGGRFLDRGRLTDGGASWIEGVSLIEGAFKRALLDRGRFLDRGRLTDRPFQRALLG